ncbi:MAG: citrate synthase [endosymbiont of Galathealinum brachiosum]|uniref:Citrate synthase n=1 Tax=endosymbiont of Galathealinum brachiosum TaxID=2200906 RepID=A0A370DL86_9GAMM|nr:MAG: citrate synthase [endosymbiont of Galathealinum brachiosum]
MDKKSEKNHVYSHKTNTSIWHEEAGVGNPYAVETCRLHGYDLFDLLKSAKFVDTLFLLFTAELPTPEQSRLLETLMIFLINPGPRHNATRAAMNAGVSKADHAHILPIGLMALGGEHLGSTEVEQSINFFNSKINLDPEEVGDQLLSSVNFLEAGDNHIAPGFGSRFNSIDSVAEKAAKHLVLLPGAGHSLKWGNLFTDKISGEGFSWLNTGVAAAVFNDLGIGAREGAGLFQLMSAPGLLAHGLEQTHKPITAMPMLQDEDYVIEK